MRVRIRLGKGPSVKQRYGTNGRVALALSSLLTPASLMAAVLGLWRLGADLNLTGGFAISTGPFAYWQTWMLTAAGLRFCSSLLTRYAAKSARKEALRSP
jgi:hypothetical protein